MSEKSGRGIRADLNAERSAEFEQIKKELGIESDADAIRYLIREKYRELHKSALS